EQAGPGSTKSGGSAAPSHDDTSQWTQRGSASGHIARNAQHPFFVRLFSHFESRAQHAAPRSLVLRLDGPDECFDRRQLVQALQAGENPPPDPPAPHRRRNGQGDPGGRVVVPFDVHDPDRAFRRADDPRIASQHPAPAELCPWRIPQERRNATDPLAPTQESPRVRIVEPRLDFPDRIRRDRNEAELDFLMHANLLPGVQPGARPGEAPNGPPLRVNPARAGIHAPPTAGRTGIRGIDTAPRQAGHAANGIPEVCLPSAGATRRRGIGKVATCNDKYPERHADGSAGHLARLRAWPDQPDQETPGALNEQFEDALEQQAPDQAQNPAQCLAGDLSDWHASPILTWDQAARWTIAASPDSIGFRLNSLSNVRTRDSRHMSCKPGDVNTLPPRHSSPVIAHAATAREVSFPLSSVSASVTPADRWLPCSPGNRRSPFPRSPPSVRPSPSPPRPARQRRGDDRRCPVGASRPVRPVRQRRATGCASRLRIVPRCWQGHAPSAASAPSTRTRDTTAPA